MNIHFHTLGCKVNQYETEVMREGFLKCGYTADESAGADAVIINSCTVTAESDKKTRQLVRRCRRENPQAVIVLTGCMVQAFPESAENLSEADIVIGNRDVSKIITALQNFDKDRYFCVEEHKNGDLYNTFCADIV